MLGGAPRHEGIAGVDMFTSRVLLRLLRFLSEANVELRVFPPSRSPSWP